MTEFQVSKRVKEARESRGLSQKVLAAAVGCHPSFITKLEKLEMGSSLPSRELSDAMAGVLGMPPDELWIDVETARGQMLHRRLRTKGAAVQETMLRQGIPIEPLTGQPTTGPSLDDIIADVTVDAEVRAAVRAALPHLAAAMTDPEMRQVINMTLQGWAQLAQRKRRRRH